MKNAGDKFLFHCNFDYKKLPVAVPEFYKECNETLLNENNPSTIEDIVNQILWNKRFICIGKNSVYNGKLSSIGLNKVGDLYDSAGLLVLNGEPLRSFLSPSDRYLLISMLDTIPLIWQNLLNNSKPLIAYLTTPLSSNSFYISFINDIISLKKNFNRKHKFVSKACTIPTARKKYEEVFNTEVSQ